jgi:WD40 repeat protein
MGVFMKKLLKPIHLFLELALFLGQSAFSTDTITLLDRGEPYASMISQNGVFWIGQSRRQFNSDYRIEVYTSEGKLVDRVALTHSIMSLKEGGNGTVVMTGINPSVNLTEYTLAKLENGKIQKRTTQVTVDGFINFWIGTLNGRHFFADMGGNPHDTSQDLTLPAQTIFYTSNSAPRYMSTRVRMPVAGTIHNNKILLISGEAIGSPRTSIVEVDPRTEAKRVLLSTKDGQFSSLKVLPGTHTLVTIARAQNKVLLVDSNSGEVKREIPTQGYTRSVVVSGHCLLAGNDTNNTIEVFDLNSNENKSVLKEAITLSEDEFSGIKQIAVDDTTGVVFAQAALACNPMVQVCDKDNNRVVSLGNDFAKSIQKLCR